MLHLVLQSVPLLTVLCSGTLGAARCRDDLVWGLCRDVICAEAFQGRWTGINKIRILMVSGV